MDVSSNGRVYDCTMSRLPFDPAKTRAAKQAKADHSPGNSGSSRGKDAPITVSQLAGRLEAAITSGVPGTVRVVGEIGQAKQRTHWYFSLKDDDAVLDAVMWASTARRTGTTIAAGDRVVVRGRVEFYKPQGRVTLIAESVEPEGIGSLNLEFMKLVAEARSLGWLDPERKRPLPIFPKRIAVITSEAGAALQDVIDTARRRCPAVDLVVVDALVQGDRAAQDIVRAIDSVNRSHLSLGIEAILLTRGGGSIEQLWAFNERVVVEAVVGAAVPIVAAIGHESDTTLAELVADERAATPTQAAMRLTPDRADLLRQVDGIARRLRMTVARRVEARAHRLEMLASRSVLADPARMTQQHAERIDRLVGAADRALTRSLAIRARYLHALSARLERVRPDRVLRARLVRLERASMHLSDVAHAAAHRTEFIEHSRDRLSAAGHGNLDRCRARLEHAAGRLKAVGPLAVLERGFTVTTDDRGHLVRSVREAIDAGTLVTRFSDGSVETSVPESTKKPGVPRGVVSGAAKVRKSTSKRSQGEPPEADQLDLF
jgi:exodeoxyribonuclease VII large subunit